MRVPQLVDRKPAELVSAEIPMRVREAAVFLGVRPQTVYLRVERKQIPHLRVMGRNIRFLKSDLEPFRTQFKLEVENGRDRASMMVSFSDVATVRSGGCATGMRPAAAAWNRQTQKTGTRRSGGSVNVSRPATIARWTSCGGANDSLFRIGQTPSWRTTRSRRSGHRRPTRPMSWR